MVENKKEMKKQKCINPIVYWGIGIGLPLGILALTGLFTDDLKIISFFVLIFVLYTYALSKIFPIVNIANELNGATNIAEDIVERSSGYKNLVNELNDAKLYKVDKLFI